MRIPKRYGQYRVEKCPFCGQRAISVNSQGVPVCSRHKQKKLGNLKCVCGEPLEMRNGKFGVFFTCISCGAISLKKAVEVNDL